MLRVMSDRAVLATRSAAPRPFLVFLGGSGVGLAILLLTQVLSESAITIGPWSLNGNGALAVPFIGFPLAIYAGWSWLAERAGGRELGVRLVLFSVGLALGAGVMGLIFALPMAIIAGAIYTTFDRGQGRLSDRLLWIAFAISVGLSALPVLGVFGVALLPGSLIPLARGKSPRMRVGLGALLAATATLIVFVVPLLFAGTVQS